MMQRLLRHKLLIGAATLLAAGSAGGAYAATQSGTNPRQAFLNDVAKRLHVTPSRLRAAVRAAMLDRLEAAVEAGQLTQAQANRIKQRIEQGGLLLFGGPPRFGSPGRFGPPGPGAMRLGPLSAAARYLGLTDLQLFGDLRQGKTLAQVAQSRGKSVSGLKQALRSAAKARLDALVAAGRITQAQEQRRLNRLSARIDRLVNHAPPALPGGGPASIPAPPAGPPAGPAFVPAPPAAPEQAPAWPGA